MRAPLPAPLILASASPQRKNLLRRLGVPFRVVPSGVSEKGKARSPGELAEALARRKALFVAKKHPRALVLGADTLVFCRGRLIFKPKDRKDSLRILLILNGRRQEVFTGAALAWEGGEMILSGVERTLVYARRLGDEALSRLAGKHMDKAGAYAVQDRDDPFIARIRGRRDNVIGLPLRLVRELLGRAGKSKRWSRGVRPTRRRSSPRGAR